MIRNVKLVGFDALQEKLKFDVLMQPEMQTAVETITGRMMRGGKGIGVQHNTLTSSIQPLSSTVVTTLVWPRTKGVAWGRYQEKVVKGIVATNAVKKAVQRIEERWAAGGVS